MLSWPDEEIPPPWANDPAFEEEERPVPQPQQSQRQPPRNGRAPYTHKTNRGSMFENDRKTKDQQPDFTGSVDVEGTIYWVSAWKDMTAGGKKKLSLAIKLQEERPQQAAQTQRPQGRQQAKW